MKINQDKSSMSAKTAISHIKIHESIDKKSEGSFHFSVARDKNLNDLNVTNKIRVTNLVSTNITARNIDTTNLVAQNVTATTITVDDVIDNQLFANDLSATIGNIRNLTSALVTASTITTGYLSATLIYQAGFPILPPGLIMEYAGSTAPGGWLWCDGSAISQATYPALCAVLGDTYTAHVGSTYYLPDMRGRVPVGEGTGPGLSTRNLGVTGGIQSVTLGVSQIPVHTHSGTTASGGIHSHSATDSGHAHTQYTYNDDFNVSNQPGQTPPAFGKDADTAPEHIYTWSNINTGYANISIANSTSHTHTFTTDGGTGGGGAHENMQPFLVVKYIIKY